MWDATLTPDQLEVGKPDERPNKKQKVGFHLL
jgi:hypothetical protein